MDVFAPKQSAPRDLNRRDRLSAWALAAAALCLAALAAPFFFGQVYVADDLGAFHLPLRQFYGQQLGRGEPFDWMPSLFGGFYVAGEGQLGAYHPWHRLLYGSLPLWAAFDLELLASYPLMFVGMYVFLRRVVHERAAALFGALAFTFGGFNLLHFVHPNAVAIVAHMGWLLWLIDVALGDTTRPRRAAAALGIALLTGSQLLLGYPQYVWFSLLLEVAYVAWQAWARPTTAGELRWLGLAKVLGMLIGGVQLLPTLHALSQSVRQTGDVDFAVSGSLHPLNLIQVFAPYLFRTRVVGQNTHELGLYLGAVPVVLCVWLLARHKQWGRLRPLVRAACFFAGFATLLAMGEFGGIYSLQSWLPLVNRFRFPCRAIVLAQFALAAMSAAAMVQLQDARRTHSRTEFTWQQHLPLLMAVTLSVSLAIAGPLVWPDHVASTALVWLGPCLIAAAAVLVVLAERGRPAAFVGLVLLTAIDLSSYGLSYSVYPHTATLEDYVARTSAPPQPAARVAAPSIDDLQVSNRMLLAGVHRIDGYAGLAPAKRLDYRTRAAQQLAGAAWVWEPADGTSNERRWVPIAPAAPRARLVSKISAPSEGTAPQNQGPAFDTVAVDTPLELPAGPPGRAMVIHDSPGHINMHTAAASRQLLVTTESFDSGWQVVINGQERPVVRVDGDFLGCVVEAGNQRVEFEFRPVSLQFGGLLSACGLGLMLLAFCFRLRGWRLAQPVN